MNNAQFQELQKQIKLLHSAFPDGVHKHRAEHEAWALAKQAEMEFWKELKLEIAKKGALGILYLLGSALLLGLLVKFGIFSSGWKA